MISRKNKFVNGLVACSLMVLSGTAFADAPTPAGNEDQERILKEMETKAPPAAESKPLVEPEPAAVAGAGATILFGGFDIREKANYPYVGVIHHFSGDVLASGFLFRAFAWRADYEYSTDLFNVDATANAYDVMVGYQKVFDKYALRGYVGLDYENHDLSPDNPLDSNQGSDTGVKVQAEYETDYALQNYGSVIASYGTAKDRYWARARGGREFSGYVVGPEVLFTGDNEFDEWRVGGFVMARKFLPVSFSVSAGYSDSGSRRAGSSPYLTLEISRTF